MSQKNPARKKYYIGLSCTFHDPAIAIINEAGEILYAEAVERFIQSKRAAGVLCDDKNLVDELIKKYCADGKEFIICYSWSKAFFNKLHLKATFGIQSVEKKWVDYILKDMPANVLSSYDLVGYEYLQYGSLVQVGISLKRMLHIICPGSIIKEQYFNHHSTHAAYACYTSPFDEGACLVMDGIGEGGSFSLYRYENNKITPTYVQKKLASLGFFYALITNLCGFDMYNGEQWKVMGLAPYGKLDNEYYNLLKSMVRIKDHDFEFTLVKPWVRSLQELSSRLNNGKRSFEENAGMAFTGQYFFSEIMQKLLNGLYKLSPSENLIYTGGCALNSSFNGEIVKRTSFKKIYIPSAPSDDGNAIGAALLSFYKDNSLPDSIHRSYSPYLGSCISGEVINKFFKFSGMGKTQHCVEHLAERTATLLADGKIVGWIQGRAEFGPRALGNRSILADPRSSSMKDKINSTIKFREDFRPFAPSILHEYGNEYFEDYDYSPFMEKTFYYRKEVVNKIPAVVHVDNTGRLQSVKQETNEKFYSLIKSFNSKTGVPLLLNTSFNIMGKPIIHTMEDAIGVFFTSGLDVLVAGDHIIEK